MGVFDRVKRKGKKLFGAAEVSQAHDTRARVLFVSHEATRTGAPLIVLNLLRQFSERTDARLESIFHDGGKLIENFAEVSKVHCLKMPREHSDGLNRRVRKLLNLKKDSRPVLAICNSMETRFIARSLFNLGIPVLFLIHELPSSYEAADYQNVFAVSEKVVFPVEAVRKQTSLIVDCPENKTLVIPQGLLDPQFGRGVERQRARDQIRSELNIPKLSRIALGCGTLDLRKGIDHFAAIARTAIQREASGTDYPLHFVWVGDGPRWKHSIHHYVNLDLIQSGIVDRVHFVGERQSVENYFVGADVFLLTSRVDPFPCVVHEAMAANLPIITFDNSGGAADAVKNGAGMIVPYCDYEQAAQMIFLLNSQKYFKKSIQQNSLDRVSTDYCFTDYANKILNVAEGIAGVNLANFDQRDYLPFAA